jgi:SH3-like domain-containing protein
MVAMDTSGHEVVIREAYAAQYGDPIAFRHGDKVQVQRTDAEFPEWLWCRGPDEKEGWVHRSFLSQSCGHAIALVDYSAKELTVAAGEQGRMIRILDGWALVELEGSRMGWVPERVLHAFNI